MAENRQSIENYEAFKRGGSLRTLIPFNGNGDSQLSMSVKRIDRNMITSSTKEYAVFMREYNILAEYNMLSNEDLKGMYIVPSARSSFLWFGVQFIRQGIYQGGVFRFHISLPSNYPDGGCPKVIFETKIFHPLVNSETGELCTEWGFPEWKRTNKMVQLIQYITKILTKLDAKMTGINQVASSLLQSNLEAFEESAKQCVQKSIDDVYNPPTTDDPHYIRFSPYKEEIHDLVKNEIYQPKVEEDSKVQGFSWVRPDSVQSLIKQK